MFDRGSVKHLPDGAAADQGISDLGITNVRRKKQPAQLQPKGNSENS